MVNRKRFAVAVIAVICMFVSMLAAIMGGGHTAYAESPVAGADGTYSASVNLSGLAMGADNFSSAATVEKNGDNYYLTFGHSSSISDMALISGNMQTGYTVKTESGWTYYTYTMSAQRLQGSLSFSAHINAMARDVEFTISLELTNAVRTGAYAYDGERPAEYVPVIATSAGDTQMVTGTVYSLTSATATLGDETLEVTAKAYYDGESVEITDNQLTLSRAGDYTVVYRAESATYKTNYGNNTYAEYTYTVTSRIGASALAKAEGVSEGAAIQASAITSGTVYQSAASAMKTVADNFHVVGVEVYNNDGTTADVSGGFTLYLLADSTYDRNKVAVYLMSDGGTLTQLSCSPYGRYVKLTANSAGTYIVCIPGVAFVMPIWGYALILVGCLLVLTAAIVITIVVVKKRRKKAKHTV